MTRADQILKQRTSRNTPMYHLYLTSARKTGHNIKFDVRRVSLRYERKWRRRNDMQHHQRSAREPKPSSKRNDETLSPYPGRDIFHSTLLRSSPSNERGNAQLYHRRGQLYGRQNNRTDNTDRASSRWISGGGRSTLHCPHCGNSPQSAHRRQSRHQQSDRCQRLRYSERGLAT
ncbi:hypothetical protein M8818_000910 [Zalaria obscura]|uniref:Uncharacterized protein n=1 Tax=Zalaria obscura TaxID=2024903 RepID=A0ACC3SLB4_9PEZI